MHTVSPAFGPDPDTASPRELNLSYYVRLVWKRRHWVLGISLACGLAMFLITFVQPRSYEAQLSLGVTRPGQADADVNPGNYRPIIANQGLAADVIRRLALKNGDAPLSPRDFLEHVLHVDEVRGTSLLLVRVTYTDPETAARIANVVAERATEILLKLGNDETLQVRSSLGGQVDDSRQRLSDVREALTTFKSAAQIDLLRKDTEALLAERAGLLKLDVAIAAGRAELARAEQELAALSRTNSLRRTVEQDPALAEVVRREHPSESPLGLSLRYEDSNPVHQKMEERVTSLRADLAGQEKRRSELVGAHKLSAAEHVRLRELYAKESELARLELDLKLAEKVFEQAMTQYETARLQVASHGVVLQVVDRAEAPPAPLPRGAGRAGLLAFLLAFGGVSAVIVLNDAFRQALSED